jgi:hypothetical protein
MRTLMIGYKRNIKTKLIFIRLILVAYLAIAVLLITRGLNDYAYVLVTFLVLGSIFPISDLFIDKSKIVVKQYFIYGLISRTTTFLIGENISLNAFEIEMNNAATWADFETDSLTSPLTEKEAHFKESRPLR